MAKVPACPVRQFCFRYWLYFAVCFAVSASLFAVTESGPLSQRRLVILRNLVQRYFENLDDLGTSDYRIVKAISESFAEVQSDCPAVPSSRKPYAESDCVRAAKKLTDDLVGERYPPLDNSVLEAEAAEKYPIYEKGDLVTVWYNLNPVRPSKVTGVYRNRTSSSIQVGRHVILIRDMAMIKQNEKELLKFDPDKSNALRKEYVNAKLAAYEETKKLFEEKVSKISLQAKQEWAVAENEKMGFIFYRGTWNSARDVIEKLVGEERERVKRERRLAAEKKMATKNTRILAAIRAQNAFLVFADGKALYQNPELIAAEIEALKKQREELSAREAREQAAAQAEVAAAETAANQQGAEENSPKKRKKTVIVPDEEATGLFGLDEDETGDLIVFGLYLLVGLVVLVAGGIGVNLFLKRQKDPARFFRGRGSLQKKFWAAAEADPEHFKYVAYRYGSINDARDALLQLSYITENSSGQLRCRKDILFGFYPHQEKFVTFVGGIELGYAMWREASAILPELPGAEYFRVSTAPDVRLELPNLEELLNESGLDVTHVEDREGSGEDYAHYVVYRAPDKQNALEFLKLAQVQESGVHVIVETPEGTWGKDENGIYQEGEARESGDNVWDDEENIPSKKEEDVPSPDNPV